MVGLLSSHELKTEQRLTDKSKLSEWSDVRFIAHRKRVAKQCEVNYYYAEVKLKLDRLAS